MCAIGLGPWWEGQRDGTQASCFEGPGCVALRRLAHMYTFVFLFVNVNASHGNLMEVSQKSRGFNQVQPIPPNTLSRSFSPLCLQIPLSSLQKQLHCYFMPLDPPTAHPRPPKFCLAGERTTMELGPSSAQPDCY